MHDFSVTSASVDGQRPWTVKALVAMAVFWTVWSAVFDASRDWLDPFILGASAFIILRMWQGGAGAFALAFACSLFAAFAVGLHAITAIAAGNADIPLLVLGVATVGMNLYLLRHPATKGFINEGRPEELEEISEVDWLQLCLISLFGLLTLSVPLLWAVGVLKGPALYGLGAMTVGVGIAVVRPYIKSMSGAAD